MKNIVGKFFRKTSVDFANRESQNMRALRAIEYENGVKVYPDLLADVLAAKVHRLNNYDGVGEGNYMPRTLSIARTVYP